MKIQILKNIWISQNCPISMFHIFQRKTFSFASPSSICLSARTLPNSTIGKITANSSPLLSPPLPVPDKRPTSPGPPAQPDLPPKAKKANITVPPLGHRSAAKLNVPGHIIPTERPVSAHPASESTGIGENTASR